MGSHVDDLLRLRRAHNGLQVEAFCHGSGRRGVTGITQPFSRAMLTRAVYFFARGEVARFGFGFGFDAVGSGAVASSDLAFGATVRFFGAGFASS